LAFDHLPGEIGVLAIDEALNRICVIAARIRSTPSSDTHARYLLDRFRRDSRPAGPRARLLLFNEIAEKRTLLAGNGRGERI
jgi:hypothetical protein